MLSQRARGRRAREVSDMTLYSVQHGITAMSCMGMELWSIGF